MAGDRPCTCRETFGYWSGAFVCHCGARPWAPLPTGLAYDFVLEGRAREPLAATEGKVWRGPAPEVAHPCR